MSSSQKKSLSLRTRLVLLSGAFLFLGVSLGFLFYFMSQWKNDLKQELTNLHNAGHKVTYETMSSSVAFVGFSPAFRFHFENVSYERKGEFLIELPSLTVQIPLVHPEMIHGTFEKGLFKFSNRPYEVTVSGGKVSLNTHSPFSALYAQAETIDVSSEQELLLSFGKSSLGSADHFYTYKQIRRDGTEHTYTNTALSISFKAKTLRFELLQPASGTPFTTILLKLIIVDPIELKEFVRDPQHALQKWRDKNGILELSTCSLNWGDATASWDGTFALDDQLRIEAAGGLSITHVQDFLTHLSKTNTMNKKDMILVNLSLGLLASNKQVYLPFTLQSGTLSIGNFLKLDVPLRIDLRSS